MFIGVFGKVKAPVICALPVWVRGLTGNLSISTLVHGGAVFQGRRVAVWRDWEGGTVAFVLNQEGGTVLGGCFCLGRAVLLHIFPGRVCLPDVITLQRLNHPPDLVGVSGCW